jgi:hypothetical protein
MLEEKLMTIRNRALQQLVDFEALRAASYLAYKLAAESAKQMKPTKFTIPFLSFAPSVGIKNRILRPSDLPSLFQKCESNFLDRMALQVQVAQFEYFFFDMLRVVLADNPRHLPSGKRLDYGAITSAATHEEIVTEMINRELNELKYQTLAKWFEYFEAVVSGVSPSSKEVSLLTEAKATRDLLAHNNGVVNEIYIRKVKGNARAGLSEDIPVNGTYVLEVWKAIVAIVDHISTTLVKKLVGRKSPIHGGSLSPRGHKGSRA